MQKDGERLPSPSTLDDLRNDPAMKGAVAFLVELAESEKTIRFNITARTSQLSEIDTRARAAKLSRSAYMVHSALGKKTAGAARRPASGRKTNLRRKSA
jgi:hypothetical protein